MKWKHKLLISGSMLLLLAADQQDPTSKEKEQLCAVYVDTPRSDEESSSQVVEKVEKKLKDKKKWFHLVEDPLEADIRIEVTRHGDAKNLDQRMDRKETSADGKIELSHPGLLQIEFGYFIEFALVVPKQFQGKMTVTGRGPDSAAEDVARIVRTICDTYRE